MPVPLQNIATNSAEGVVAPPSTELFVQALRAMLVARITEEKLSNLYRAGGKIVGGVYLGRGQEAFSAALGCQLEKGRDVYGPLIRDQAGRSGFGEPLLDCLRTYLGSAQGPMRGRDGNVHRGRPLEGMPAMISHLGSLVSVVSGMLFARRLKGVETGVGGTSIGDGGTSTGAFHEALNSAAVEKLPLVVGIANNHFAYSTPNDRQFACGDLVDRAAGYGVGGYSVDGTDLASCLQGFHEAIKRARAGEGPQIVVGSLLRLAGHGEHDDASYIPDEMRAQSIGKDCLKEARARALSEGWVSEKELASWEDEANQQFAEALEVASREDGPNPFEEKWMALASPVSMEEEHRESP